MTSSLVRRTKKSDHLVHQNATTLYTKIVQDSKVAVSLKHSSSPVFPSPSTQRPPQHDTISAHFHQRTMSSVAEDIKHDTLKLSAGTAAHIWRPQQSPYRAVIVLQHGYAEYAARYTTSHHNIINHMLASGYIVYAMDLWGHGQSPGPRGIVHLQKAIRDHLELRKLAVKQNPDLPIILFGHSLGGLVTAGSTVADGDNVKGVVLTGPAFPGPFPHLARIALGAAARAMPKTSIPRPANVEGLTRDETELKKYWEDEQFHKSPISFLLAATALDAAAEVRAKAKDWVVPTLVLHGNEDAYCDWKASEVFVESIGSEDKEFRVYEEGRHEILHDLEGDHVLERIMGWIARHI
jgi:acylglycerol lipase